MRGGATRTALQAKITAEIREAAISHDPRSPWAPALEALDSALAHGLPWDEFAPKMRALQRKALQGRAACTG